MKTDTPPPVAAPHPVAASTVSGERATRARVVVVGAGFGGLACAKVLGNSGIDVIIIDRRNHNLFQPLLYQVATAALSPADIAEPIRKTLARYVNIRVELDEVVAIATDAKRVQTRSGRMIGYDFLVLATGSEYNYFGHEEWRTLAPGLKTLREARSIRQRLLLAFERAELSEDAVEKKALLTTVIVGGGPTGVEMAGAVSELGRYMISRDFRNLAPNHMRVVLVEASTRLLASFPEVLATYAADYMRDINVEVLTGARVTMIGSDHVFIDGEKVDCGCVVWGAGVKASPAANWLQVPQDRVGRVLVASDLSVPDLRDVYVVGDTAHFRGADGEPLPALAQVAKQQGQHLGKALRRRIEAGVPVSEFVFQNRGNTAVIGRHAAIFDFGSWRLKGRVAWFLWALVHVYLLINFEKRVLVSIQWISRYLTGQRGARIIDEANPTTDKSSFR